MYTSVSNNVALISAGFFFKFSAVALRLYFTESPNEIPTAPPVGGGCTAGQMHAVALGCLGVRPRHQTLTLNPLPHAWLQAGTTVTLFCAAGHS